MRNQMLWKKALALGISAVMVFSTPAQVLCAQNTSAEVMETAEPGTEQQGALETETTGNLETAEQPEEMEKPEDTETSLNTEATENLEAAEQPEEAEKSEEAETAEQPEEMEKPEEAEPAEQPETEENSESTENTETTENIEETESKEIEIIDEIEEIEEELKGTESESGERVTENGIIYQYDSVKNSYKVVGYDTNAETVSSEILAEINGIPVTEIGEQALSGCSKLSGKLIVPNSIEKIGEGAFAYCTELTGINLPEGLKELGIADTSSYKYGYLGVFENCTGLKGTITFPAGLEVIGNNTFRECSNLNGIVMQEGLHVIGIGAFAECKELSGTIDFPKGLKYIYAEAFSECEKITGVDFKEGLESIGEGPNGGAFYGTGIKGTLTFPNGLRKIAYGSFEWCEGITSINLPEGLTELDAFRNCKGLKGTLKLPSTVEKVGGFSGCENLTEVIFPEGLKEIDTSAFSNCYGLKGTLKLPDSVEIIGASAFFNCSGLKGTLKLPSKLKKIEWETFYRCTGITGVTIPKGVTAIEGSVFSNGVGMTSTGAFAYCSGIKKVTLPKTIETIGDGAFFECTALSTLTIPEGVQKISQYAFYDCKKIKKVKIPQSVDSIGEYAFFNCSNLETVTLMEGLQKIGAAAFGNCIFKKITVPESVKTIAKGAFPYSVKTLYCYKNSAAHTYAKKYKSDFGFSVSLINDSKKKVTFNANGGKNISMKAKRVASGKAVGKLPTVEKAGYLLKGWYTKKSGGKKVTSKTKISKNQTLYAHWTKVTAPGAVTSIVIKETDGVLPTQIECSAVKGADGYEFVRSESDSSFGDKKKLQIECSETNIHSFSEWAYSEGVTFYFKARAYKLDSTGKKVYGAYGPVISYTIPEY